MSSSDISAIGIAIAAIITAFAALRNSSNSKEVVERLKEEVSKLRDKLIEERKVADEEISKLKDHNTFQDEVLINREKKIDALTAENKELRDKIGKWHEWGLSIGRLLNETQLSVGYLMSNSKKQTAPLPPLGEIPEQPRVDNEYQ